MLIINSHVRKKFYWKVFERSKKNLKNEKVVCFFRNYKLYSWKITPDWYWTTSRWRFPWIVPSKLIEWVSFWFEGRSEIPLVDSFETLLRRGNFKILLWEKRLEIREKRYRKILHANIWPAGFIKRQSLWISLSLFAWTNKKRAYWVKLWSLCHIL